VQLDKAYSYLRRAYEDLNKAGTDLSKLGKLLSNPKQLERKPLTDVLVPLQVLEAAESSLGSFCSDQGWDDADMQNMDNLSAYIARHKAAHGITDSLADTSKPMVGAA